MTVAAHCAFAGLPATLAFLDTGCSLSVVGGEPCEALRESLGEAVAEARLHTRLGEYDGEVHRCPVVLRADAGESLAFEATVLLAVDWQGPPVLGYPGALDRIRFALDPGLVPGEARIFFAAAA